MSTENNPSDSLLCCLCLNDLPMETSKITRFTCCGSGVHTGCHDELNHSPTDKNNTCPKCRAKSPIAGSKEEIQRLRQWVEKKKVWAMCALGDRYKHGQSVTQSHEKAVALYTLAAEQGCASAQLNLGVMYKDGTGVQASDTKAVALYTLAAEQGNVGAQLNLGGMYKDGAGVTQSDTKAAQLYQRAAEQGDASARFNLGTMYRNGTGVEQSKEKALELYQLAAEQRHAGAMVQLGVVYVQGQDVDQSIPLAREWWMKAAKQGDEVAVQNLQHLQRLEASDGKKDTPTTPQQLKVGFLSLCYSMALLLQHPWTLVTSSMRFAMLAALVYVGSTCLWYLLWPLITLVETVTSVQVATQESLLRTCAGLICVVCQHISPRCFKSALFSQTLATVLPPEKAQQMEASKILYPLRAAVFSLLTKMCGAMLIAGLLLPILVVSAPMTLLGGSIAMVPALALMLACLMSTVVLGGSGLLWRYCVKPFSMLCKAVEYVSLPLLMVVGVGVYVASRWGGYEFTVVQLFLQAVNAATTFHFSVLLTESLMAPLVIRVDTQEMTAFLHRYRFVLFGFGVLPYLMLQRWPLWALVCMEMMQGAAGVLVGRLLQFEGSEGFFLVGGGEGEVEG